MPNGRYSHDLVGATRVEILDWPGGGKNAVVVEDESVSNITIEVDVRSGEFWTWSKNNHPTLQAFSNNPRPSAGRRMVVIVPKGKKNIVHFVKR
jgi:hypothetical protein